LRPDTAVYAYTRQRGTALFIDSNQTGRFCKTYRRAYRKTSALRYIKNGASLSLKTESPFFLKNFYVFSFNSCARFTPLPNGQ